MAEEIKQENIDTIDIDLTDDGTDNQEREETVLTEEELVDSDLSFIKSNTIRTSKLKQPLDAAPTYNPIDFYDQFAHYNDSLYVNINNNWVLLGGNKAKVRAYKSAIQGVSDVTWTKVEFEAESYDVGGNYDATTNYRFTAPRDGKYSVHISLYAVANATADSKNIAIRVNGESLPYSSEAIYTTVDGSAATYTLTDTIDLSADDYIEAWYYHNSGVARNINAGERLSYMTITEL